MVPDTVWTGIVVGAAGGAVAGLVLWIVGRLNEYENKWRESRKIYRWLHTVTTAPESESKWCSTRAIASFTNLPEDRVRELCSRHSRIVLSTQENEVWGIAGIAREESKTGVV